MYYKIFYPPWHFARNKDSMHTYLNKPVVLYRPLRSVWQFTYFLIPMYVIYGCLMRNLRRASLTLGTQVSQIRKRTELLVKGIIEIHFWKYQCIPNIPESITKMLMTCHLGVLDITGKVAAHYVLNNWMSTQRVREDWTRVEKERSFHSGFCLVIWG